MFPELRKHIWRRAIGLIAAPRLWPTTTATKVTYTEFLELVTQGKVDNVTINNLSTAYENLAAANSRIRDMDMAEETSELTKSQILMQSGVSVLGQANSTIKTALGLLGGGGS